MSPLAYRAGCLAANHRLGLEKTASAIEASAVSKAIGNLIPKSTMGKSVATGGLGGTAMGTHMLMDDRRQPGTKMDPPHIVPRGNPLMYEPRY